MTIKSIKFSFTKSLFKYVLYSVNTISVIVAIILIIVGVIGVVQCHVYDIDVVFLPLCFVGLGLFIMVFAIFGCYGAKHESIISLNVLSLVFLLLACCQIVFTAMVLVYKKEILAKTKMSFELLWEQREESEDNKMIIDIFQQTLKCCGSQSWNDYEIIPASCCSMYNDFCVSISSYQDGCSLKLNSSLKKSALFIEIIGIAMALVELFTAVLSCLLAKVLFKEKK